MAKYMAWIGATMIALGGIVIGYAHGYWAALDVGPPLAIAFGLVAARIPDYGVQTTGPASPTTTNNVDESRR